MTAAQQAYRMLGNENLWGAAERCHRVLSDANITYSVRGGVAVCLHGYQRNTVDLDLIIPRAASEVVHSALTRAGFTWDEKAVEFRTEGGIAVQRLLAGERAGKGAQVKVPEPIGEANVEVREGLWVVRLFRLIEMKLASGTSNLRRTHKDFADVVELIALRNLDGSFAQFLHPSLRPTFRKLVRHAQSDEAD